jgi:hypothetical protein
VVVVVVVVEEEEVDDVDVLVESVDARSDERSPSPPEQAANKRRTAQVAANRRVISSPACTG